MALTITERVNQAIDRYLDETKRYSWLLKEFPEEFAEALQKRELDAVEKTLNDISQNRSILSEGEVNVEQ